MFRDRTTLVNLINKLSGINDKTLDDIEDSNSIETGSDAEIGLSPGLDQEKNSPMSPATSIIENNDKMEHNKSDIESKENLIDQFSKENSLENPVHLERKLDESSDEVDYSHNKIPVVGEAIEESVMIVQGEGSGQECDTGNPDEISTQNDTSKNEDVKKPKLWSIETICSSSKEVREETINVPPMSGFFFGDNSVSCFSNVSNREISHPNEEKLGVESSSKENSDELKKNKKLAENDSTTSFENKSECDTKNHMELSDHTVSKQSVFNIKVHEEEVQITERNANEVFVKSESSIVNDAQKTNVFESTSVSMCSEPLKPSNTQVFENNDDSKLDSEDTIDDKKMNSIDIEIESKQKLENKNINQQYIDNTNLTINVDKQIAKKEILSENLEDIKNNESALKLESNQQSIINIDQNIKTVKPIVDNMIKINTETASEINKNYEVEKINISCVNDKANEPLVNAIDESTDSIKKYDDVVVDSCVLKNNQIQKNDCLIIDNKEIIVNTIDEDKTNDTQVSDGVFHLVKPVDSSETSTNDQLNQCTELNNLSLNQIDCSSKIHTKTVKENVDHCFENSKQITDDQKNEKSKEISHNISKIIHTGISESEKANEQLSNSINENKLKNNFQEKNKCTLNLDSQLIASNKHKLDKISQKSDDINQISKSLNSENETNEDLKLKYKPDHPIVKTESLKIISQESKLNIEESQIEETNILNVLTPVKDNDNSVEDINTSVLLIPKVNEKQIVDKIDDISVSQIDDDKLKVVSLKQCSKDIIKKENVVINYMEIKRKNKFLECENKIDVNSENKLDSIELRNENIVDNSKQENSLALETPMKINETKLDEILRDGKIIIDFFIVL